MSTRDDADSASMGFRSSDELAAWQREQPCASLAKPQPVGGALTDEVLYDLWRGTNKDVHTGDILKNDILFFGRVVERTVLATLSAPVAQPVPLSSMPELQAAVARGLADGSLVPQGLATPIAAQPAAAEPDKGSSLHRAIDAVESILRGNSVYFGRETILKIVNAAAPAQAAAVPEAAFYVSDHDVEMLKDKMVAGRGCFLSKYPREGFTAYARLALSQGDVSGEGEGA
jgi:hypothetical protein